jgi:nicotinamidase-related amidase
MQNIDRNWDRFALLLIDMQKDFWNEKMTELFPDFTNNVSRLLAMCREEKLEVIHLRAYFKPDGSDWMPRYRLRGRIPCVEGTSGAERLAFADEAPGEKLIVKHSFDGFHNHDLLSYLQERGKRYLLTAGLVTSTCVLLTTASAAQLGFLPAVVEDCCADEPIAHQQTLDRYQFIFDRVAAEGIVDRYSQWTGELDQLKRLEGNP